MTPVRPRPCPPFRRPARRLALALSCTALLAACSVFKPSPTEGSVASRVAGNLPADVLLLGEQHDAAEHQVMERETVMALAGSGRLAALALEMAEQGSSSAHLPPDATEAQVRTALGWNDKAWPWAAYGPVVMAAVGAGVPVLGANLPRERMKDAMADVSLDAQLSEAAMSAQREAVRAGHCNLLPESQIVPMTRIQVARDRAMAYVAIEAKQPGKTVLLVSGAGHADKRVGVPQHMPTDLRVKAIRMRAGAPDAGDGAFDAVWATPPLPEKDYCAGVRRPS